MVMQVKMQVTISKAVLNNIFLFMDVFNSYIFAAYSKIWNKATTFTFYQLL